MYFGRGLRPSTLRVQVMRTDSTRQPVTGVPRRSRRLTNYSEGGMIRLETLIELKFLNSSFSSLSSC